MQKGEGSPPDNLADQEEGLLLVTYSLYCSQTGSAKTTCALLSALWPCPPGLLVREVTAGAPSSCGI